MRRQLARALAVGSLLLVVGAFVTVITGRSSGTLETVGASGNAVASPAYAPLVARRALMHRRPREAVPPRRAIARVQGWLGTRAGRTAFAVRDSLGRVHGVRIHERFQTASLVKAMLLVAYLADVGRERALDAGEETLLSAMIRLSDNRAASTVFDIVGEAGLARLADEIGMTDFAPSPYWGLSEISAADAVRLFAAFDRRVPHRHRRFARTQLSSIVPAQSWGIPVAARRAGFAVLFKGGWLERIVNQAARLERRDATLSLAVLTDANPSMAYGIETIEGVTARLVGSGP